MRRRHTKGRFHRAPHHLTASERLDFYSMPEPNSGCHLWLLSAGVHGYGTLEVDGRYWLAHRLAWTVARGPIPEGGVICHKCDVRTCINPDHLFLGTHADNVADKIAKGRGNNGEINGASTLTVTQVRAIKAATGTHTSVGRKFNIGRQHASVIRRGLAWRHLDD